MRRRFLRHDFPASGRQILAPGGVVFAPGEGGLAFTDNVFARSGVILAFCDNVLALVKTSSLGERNSSLGVRNFPLLLTIASRKATK
jgi:hypothetical protein